MNLKFLSTAVALLSAVAVNLQEPVAFQYTYRITANSSHPFDTASLYDYKERLIDTYENLVFGHEERDYQMLIQQNIDLFRFENCVSSYLNGSIVLVVGNGGGPTIKGDLRRNSCDESVIREKFYIFELFR